MGNETCMNLLVDGKVARTATGNNSKPGGSEALAPAAWNATEFAGRNETLAIVDQRTGGWGHIAVDHIVQPDSNSAPVAPAAAPAPVVVTVPLATTLTISGTHLLVPIANSPRGANVVLLGIYDGDQLVQNFTASLPRDNETFWLAAYPLDHFGLKGKAIKIAPAENGRAPESCRASFERIKIGSAAEALSPSDYAQPYRNQFHVSSRRGWNNDPNGMVYHNGKYHLYYQHNPFGIFWGNMHWGHFESTDLIHWAEKPVALYQKTTKDMAFSGGGFVDFNNSAGLGQNTQFANQAFTLPHEMTLRETDEGLRVFFSPVKETEKLRGQVIAQGKDLTLTQANQLLQKCQGELSEVLIEFFGAGPRELSINGIDASFSGRVARIFTDRTFNEVYADGGLSYEVRKRPTKSFGSTETQLKAVDGTRIRSLKIFRLKSIWPRT